MIPLKKKPNATTCEEYWTIRLLTHASKILLKVFTRRLQAKVEADKCLGENGERCIQERERHKRCDWSLKSVDGKKSRAQSRNIHMLCGLRKSI